MLGAIRINFNEVERKGNTPYAFITEGKNVDEILSEEAAFLDRYEAAIDEIVRRLPSEPRELELLSTVHFVAESIRALSGTDFSDKKQTVSEVLKIKKDKFGEKDISDAFDKLTEWGWLPPSATGESPCGAV